MFLKSVSKPESEKLNKSTVRRPIPDLLNHNYLWSKMEKKTNKMF